MGSYVCAMKNEYVSYIEIVGKTLAGARLDSRKSHYLHNPGKYVL